MPFLLTIHLFHLCWRSPEFCFSHKCFYHTKKISSDTYILALNFEINLPLERWHIDSSSDWKCLKISKSIQTEGSAIHSWSSNASISSWIHFVIPEIIDQDFYLSLKRYTKFVDCIISHFCLRFQALKPREKEVI